LRVTRDPRAELSGQMNLQIDVVKLIREAKFLS
jgi:hypothetical protein